MEYIVIILRPFEDCVTFIYGTAQTSAKRGNSILAAKRTAAWHRSKENKIRRLIMPSAQICTASKSSAVFNFATRNSPKMFVLLRVRLKRHWLIKYGRTDQSGESFKITNFIVCNESLNNVLIHSEFFVTNFF